MRRLRAMVNNQSRRRLADDRARRFAPDREHDFLGPFFGLGAGPSLTRSPLILGAKWEKLGERAAVGLDRDGFDEVGHHFTVLALCGSAAACGITATLASP